MAGVGPGYSCATALMECGATFEALQKHGSGWQSPFPGSSCGRDDASGYERSPSVPAGWLVRFTSGCSFPEYAGRSSACHRSRETLVACQGQPSKDFYSMSHVVPTWSGVATMTPSGGSSMSGPKASKPTAGFHGSNGVSAHLPKLVIAVQME